MVCHASCGFDPPSGVHVSFSWSPSERCHDGCDTALVSGADALLLETESLDSDRADGRLGQWTQMLRDRLFPRVAFVARGLLRLDLFALKVSVRPPRHVGPVQHDGFGKQLVAIPAQTIDVDFSTADRPEAPPAGRANGCPCWSCR
jgi:hypothetical protein